MGSTDDSLQSILDYILSEYTRGGKEFGDSVINEDEEIREITSKSAIILLEKLKSGVPAKLEASKGVEKEFEHAVLETWKKPFGLLDLLLYVSLEIASEFNSTFESKPSSKHSYVREALVKEQANACLVFNEIVHLLKSGFPSGALSHWKTLHEMACISYFISKNGEDVAKRFLDYSVVESYFQSEAIYEHQQEMDCDSLAEREFKAVKRKFNRVKKSRGAEFVKKANYPYGWVPRDVLKQRSLRQIEKSVKLDILRPYYDLAGYNLYGGPEGVMFKPRIAKKTNKNLGLPVGPSNYGLADPGKIAAISLGQVTACLLLHESTVKRLIVVEALRNLVDEICDAFCEIQAEFSRE